jgi:hypothetical protein
LPGLKLFLPLCRADDISFPRDKRALICNVELLRSVEDLVRDLEAPFTPGYTQSGLLLVLSYEDVIS